MKGSRLLFLIFCLSIISTGCERGEITPLGYCRIRVVTNYDNSGKAYLKTRYSYEENQLIKIEYLFTEQLFGANDSRHTIQYAGSKTDYIIETKRGSDYLIDGKYEISNMDNKISEVVWSDYVNGEFTPSKKVLYRYSDSALMTVNMLYADNGEFRQFGKIELTYKDQKISEFQLYKNNVLDEWSLEAVRRYGYLDGKLNNWVYEVKDESGEWMEVAKWIFHYSGNLITKIEKLESFFGEWQMQGPSTKYYYDSRHRLIKIMTGNAFEKVEFEDGNSNTDYFRFPEDRFYYEPRF